MEKQKKPIPFQFVIDELEKVTPIVNPMFGCHAIYVGEKIVLIVRKKASDDPDNGVWVAIPPEHRESLVKLFPSMRSIKLFGEKTTTWQIIPEEASDFEESVLHVCQLILKNDVRIGKIPKPKRKKAKKIAKSARKSGKKK
jgi:hypothetical protein